MAYTQTDLDEVRAAKLALAKGARVVSVTIDGESVQYGVTSLPALTVLENEIAAYLADEAGTAITSFVISGDKGL